MARRRWWLAVVAGTLAVAALPAAAGAITNGGDATAGRQPFMVALVSADDADNSDAQFCGGSLITPEWVLTAGHCVFGTAPDDTEVVVGATDLVAGQGHRVAVTDVVVHPDYQNNDSDEADVALLHLASPQSAATIDLPEDDGLERPGTTLRLTGWGETSNDESGAYPTHLQQADIPVVSDAVCEDDLGSFGDESLIVCAGVPSPLGTDTGIGSCYGDSGGPLFAVEAGGWEQVGIVSFGGDTCANSYSAYTSVAGVRTFIEDTIGGIDPPVDAGVTRIAGSDRFDTAARLATTRFDAGVEVAYVVTGLAYPDALAAASAAGSVESPVLLTERDSLPAFTRDALATLAPQSIVVVGGDGAVSAGVLAQLGELTTGTVTRLAGATRYETAAAVSSLAFPSTTELVYLASGDGFADALSGAAAAAAFPSSPLLLTTRDSLPSATRDEIARLQPDTVFALGGTAAISDAVLDELRALGVTVERVAGADRYGTSALVADQWASSDEVVVATGGAFPDGLVAAALGLPLLLVPAGGVPAGTSSAIRALGASSALVLGGSGAVSDTTATALEALLIS